MQLELRNNALHVSGYVNAVERESRRLPQRMCARARSDFTEKISAGAFAAAIADREIRLMYNHTRDIGGTADGSLRLREDNIGLKAEAVITDSEVIAAAKRGELRGWSFGFTDAVDRWEDVSQDLQRRTLDGFTLREVSLLSVTPAYYGTSVELRGEDCCETETRAAEDAADGITTDTAKNAAEYYRREVELAEMKGAIYEQT